MEWVANNKYALIAITATVLFVEVKNISFTYFCFHFNFCTFSFFSIFTKTFLQALCFDAASTSVSRVSARERREPSKPGGGGSNEKREESVST